MQATEPRPNLLELYKHKNGKYGVLDTKNQTPAKYVIGQRYKVGIGIALVKKSSNHTTEKIIFPNCGYKEFLRKIIDTGNSIYQEILAIKWVPKRKIDVRNLGKECGSPCRKGSGCVKPGCLCNEDKEECQ